MTIDHIGYAVNDIQKARTEFEKLDYSFGNLLKDTRQNIIIQYGTNHGQRVELIQTLDSEKSSPIINILKKIGPAPYHICYRTASVEAEVEILRKRKWFLLKPPSKIIACESPEDEGLLFAYLFCKHIGLVELMGPA